MVLQQTLILNVVARAGGQGKLALDATIAFRWRKLRNSGEDAKGYTSLLQTQNMK